MAIIGISIDRENPEFTKTDFCLYMPQFTNFFFNTETDPWVEKPTGSLYWNKYYPLANAKIFYSIFGIDWELAMSYCIAHYLTLAGQQLQAPSGDTLGSIAGGGATKGVLTSASVGGFNKTYDLSKTMLDSPESFFWNQTSYGTSLMALYKTKGVPSILVVTSGPVPGAN